MEIEKLNAPRSDIPAVTHIDCSARVQTVHAETNPRFTVYCANLRLEPGSSVLVNTSVNVRDEPIVCNPEDAYRCFMNCEMDVLVIGNIVLLKEDQLPPLPSTARAEIRLFPPAKPWYISTGAYSLLEMSRIATDLQLGSVRPGVKGNDDQPV